MRIGDSMRFFGLLSKADRQVRAALRVASCRTCDGSPVAPPIKGCEVRRRLRLRRSELPDVTTLMAIRLRASSPPPVPTLFPVFVLVPLARYRRFTSTRTRERRLGDGARDRQNLMNPY